ncbi:hypothetical protein DFH07DRAFT_755187 [Mycena maculata]|uniref:CCHC-type domain-containing protein n=1 Tax=Mycena maculata TaxID=230809 RepID=A0AAD7I2Q6_9AGAR|nr:hypothetical protein DFH07DRAFT_755187 [Mycena maculata]
MPPKALPARSSKTAPSFDGKASHLKRYFCDVADTAEETERMTDDEKIHIVLRYLDINEEQLWLRKRIVGMTFDVFKSEIQKLYPGSDGEKLYTWTDLREVVRKNAEHPPSDREDFGKYQRDFQRAADFLKEKGKISPREMNELFMRGIHPDFRFRVLGRLQIKKSDQPSDEPYAMTDIIDAAEWAINGAPGTIYKEEDNALSLTRALAGMGKPAERRQGAAYQNAVEPPPQRAPLPSQAQAFRENKPPGITPYMGPNGQFKEGRCGFCSDKGHYMRECEKIEEYIRLGKCVKNQENWIVLPNGRYIPRAITGDNFLERLDKWHRLNPGQISPPGSTVKAYLETRKKREQERGKARETFDAVELPARPPSKKKVAFSPEKASAATLEAPPLASKPAPQTRYKAPIEDRVDTKELVERAMKGQFVISNKEFFAIYPDGRKYFKEQLMAKKLPAVEVRYAAMEQGQPAERSYVLRYEGDSGEPCEEKLTSSEIDALRIIDPIINDSFQVEAILDQGSEIMAMNRDLWLKLGVGLDPQKTLNMQSANSQSNSTVGVIEDLKFTIQGVDLLMQVHVVQGAPFDLLIGRPFFRFTSCQTTDNLDGTQEITITCPNTKKRVTVPMRRKVNKGKNPFRQELGKVGFHGAESRL